MTPSRTKRPRGADSGFHPWQKFRNGLEQLLSSPASPPRSWSPELRVLDKRRELVIRLASRGIDPRKIRIELSGNVMTLSGASVDLRPDHHGYRAFARSIVLPRDVNTVDVTGQGPC